MAENKKQQKLIENAEAIKNKLKNDSKKIGSKLKSAGKTLAGGVKSGAKNFGGKLKNGFKKTEAKIKEKTAESRQKSKKKTNSAARAAKYYAIKSSRFVRFLIKKEEAFGEKMVHLINRVDKRGEKMDEKKERVVRHFHLMRYLAEQNKVLLLKRGAVVMIGIIICVCTYSYVLSYEYSYHEKKLGVVKNQEDVTRIVDLISQQLTKQFGAEVSINPGEDIKFKRVYFRNDEIDSSEEVLDRLEYIQSMQATACAINADGKRLGLVDSEKTANEILNSVKTAYLSEHQADYLSVGFAENVELVPVLTVLSKLQDSEAVLDNIMTGGEVIRYHSVEKGETFSEIAKQYGISQSELAEMNPDVVPDKLSIGQQIVMNQLSPLLTVQTLEISTYIDNIQFETVYENNSSMYIGETRTKREGVYGERRVTSKIVRNNGEKMAILELNSEILSEPTAAIVYVGTKELPPLQGTGTFKYPVSGYRLTSKFGQRWGRMHYGIDLACPTGTYIRASDGGTVIFSGYSGSYGYCVKIDHGGGYVTVYAHASKLFVSRGEKVYQGQHIANVGSTGRSTGPHCHFEIQKNGKPVNPLSYL